MVVKIIPAMKSHLFSIIEIMRNPMLAASINLEAACAVVHPTSDTRETTTGPKRNPSAPAAAINALAVAPKVNHFTAIRSRKVVKPVSRIPEATARKRS